MSKITSWSIPGSNNETILGNTHMPDIDPIGILIISHGFKGYKDYGFFPALAEAASTVGLIAHRFNFSHSGMTNNIDTFERPDLFELDTWRKQSADLRTVIESKKQIGLPMVLFGHSRGGITTLLTGREAEIQDQLAAVVTAAAPSACSRISGTEKDQLMRTSRAPTMSARTGQTLYIGKIWQDEIDADPLWHDPCRAAAAIKKPLLLIHGSDDPTVPLDEARELHAAQPNAELLIIKGAGHTFNCPNPLPMDQTPPAETQQMFDAVCNFAVKHCNTD